MDPIGDVFKQANVHMLQMNRMMSQMMAQQMQMMEAMAPHNVLGSMMQGSGQYTATWTTEQLKRKNIFGEA